MCNFAVGQRVICIVEFRAGLYPAYPLAPIKGQIYTVREIELRGDVPAIRLYEILLPRWHFPQGASEGAFQAGGFRALDERKTDIGIFEEILRRAKQEEFAR